MSGRETPRIFGFEVSPLTAQAVASLVATTPRGAGQGVGLVVTPNIQHVALLGRDPAFRAAYDAAAIVTCDGFPVHYYAKWRGCPSPGRVTGCDIAAGLMAEAGRLEGARLFFVLDQEASVTALRQWAARTGLDGRVATAIPPFGFERDPALCRALADAIRDHGTTILVMGVGAPKSEVFVHGYRDSLPDCWALCVGQAVRMYLGLTPHPPGMVKALNLEWLWRIVLEPKRMLARYVTSVGGFLLAVIRDLTH
ncbi:MAG: WecB/TagA/CpsF family glycosyltransferase [Telmatospirillum sp.]|nr:WecB/TagA/CpsF family glycosyltransferase [Telmatospirillum sp.]